MTPEIQAEIATFVRTGFYSEEELLEAFCTELYEPDELDPDDVIRAIADETEKILVEQESWDEVTDCDRLDEAFLAIMGRGILAQQNAGFTQDEGYDDFVEALDCAPEPMDVLGYCFYHTQDLLRAVTDGELHIAFGPADPKKEATVGTEVGEIIREELENVGLVVDWDGSFTSRLRLPGLKWQRRIEPD